MPRAYPVVLFCVKLRVERELSRVVFSIRCFLLVSLFLEMVAAVVARFQEPRLSILPSVTGHRIPVLVQLRVESYAFHLLVELYFPDLNLVVFLLLVPVMQDLTVLN